MKQCITKLKSFKKVVTNKKSKQTPIISYKRGKGVCINFLLDRDS